MENRQVVKRRNTDVDRNESPILRKSLEATKQQDQILVWALKKCVQGLMELVYDNSQDWYSAEGMEKELM